MSRRSLVGRADGSLVVAPGGDVPQASAMSSGPVIAWRPSRHNLHLMFGVGNFAFSIVSHRHEE
jgi:hypothetical protein